MKKILFFSLMLIFAISPYISAKDKGDGRPNGGALSYGEFGRPATLDPVTSNEMIAVRVVELLFNSLVGINAKQEIVPELAEKWEITTDNRTFTFYLRKDVMWHKGQGTGEDRYLTADDVIYTYNVIIHPKTITPLKLRYEFIQEIKKIDSHTVQFVLKRPILNALAKFTFKIIPKHGPQNPEFLTRDDPFVQNPIGTGPYYLKTVTSDGEIVLLANENYFKDRPHIDKLIAKPFADQNIMSQALMFNAIDMIVLVNPRAIPEIDGDKRFILYPYNALSYSFFGYNLKNPFLADKKVRKAFTYAINRQEMLDSFFNGRGTIISGPFAPGSWAYNLDVKPISYDPAKAKELLVEAGFKDTNGDGIIEKDGK
ncbi:MAG: ABC transporter substrate-binding protein, partial [Nitrospirota bacterium]